MFEEQGHGFVQFGEQHNTELKYKRLLKQFECERELDLKPTYDPDIHGSEHQ